MPTNVMRRTGLAVLLGLICPALFWAQPGNAGLSRMVVVGDSLAAGFHNFSLVSPQQGNNFASRIASQANVNLTLPLIAPPGLPNGLQLNVPTPGKILPVTRLTVQVACILALMPDTPPNAPSNSVCGIVPGAFQTFPRINVFEPAMNLAVPGVTVEQALSLKPFAPGPSAADAMAYFILGFPGLPLPPGFPPYPTTPPVPGSQVDQAIARQPSTVLVWVGSNDVLQAAMSGDFNMLTRIDKFYTSYKTLMDRLSTTGAKLVIANVPDVTVIPYFTSVKKIADQMNLSQGQVMQKLGIKNSKDTLRPGAVPIAVDILTNKRSGPLPARCPMGQSNVPVADVPCIMTSSEAAVIRTTVFAYNLVIASQAYTHNAALVDIYSLINRIDSSGYSTSGRNSDDNSDQNSDRNSDQKVTLDFLGGFISLDAIHPTNTGHAIIANEWIRVMNGRLGLNIPAVNVAAVAAADPLVFKR